MGPGGALAVIGLGLVAGGAPLLVGPPGGDDAYYHAMRAQQQAHCWLGGVALPRWYPDLNAGLGGPEPRAYPLLPLSIHAALALAADDGVAATSLATVLIAVLAGCTMLLVGRRRGASPAWAVVVAAAWSSSPYLMIALHERASLAEGWGLALLPWVLDASLPPRPASRVETAEAALAWAVLLGTQLPLGAMACGVVAASHLARPGRERLARIVAAGVLGAALSAISWLPNLAALGRTSADLLTEGAFDVTKQFLPGGLVGDPLLARQLLLALAGAACAGVALAAFDRGAARRLGVAAAAAAFMVTPLAAPLYRYLPGLAWLQFPWRWVGLAACLATLAAVRSARRGPRVLAIALLLVPLAAVSWTRWRLAPGAPLRPGDPGVATARAAGRYGVPPILPSFPAYLPRGLDLPDALAAADRARALVTAVGHASPDRFDFRCDPSVGGAVSLPLLADDGWEVAVDGRRAGWANENGLVTIHLAGGPHRVVARQKLLPEDVAGVALSAAAALGLVLLAAGRRHPGPGGSASRAHLPRNERGDEHDAARDLDRRPQVEGSGQALEDRRGRDAGSGHDRDRNRRRKQPPRQAVDLAAAEGVGARVVPTGVARRFGRHVEKGVAARRGSQVVGDAEAPVAADDHDPAVGQRLPQTRRDALLAAGPRLSPRHLGARRRSRRRRTSAPARPTRPGANGRRRRRPAAPAARARAPRRGPGRTRGRQRRPAPRAPPRAAPHRSPGARRRRRGSRR